MKPNDLQIPQLRVQGFSVIKDRVCYLKSPSKTTTSDASTLTTSTDPFVFPDWKHQDLFGNNQPVKIEYCSGNGGWIAAKAIDEPGVNWVAVEMKRSRTRKIWAKIKNQNLANLFVVNGEGEFATAKHFPKQSVDAIFINFPDPWPKRYHARHRLVKPSFVKMMAELLKENGTVTVVTDDEGYSDWTLKIFKGSPHFVSSIPTPHYTTEWANYGNSYFETLWREQGRVIRYHHFTKIAE
ncbi:MAG: tRNA (guanine(46)-N(7))-methyltransferase TrmB [Parachlamydiaceae bacterium]|nr:tRNA (guanine(46)-N(7))-methyltransferase TrmB [Parachlamydiaceae bacterium]